MTKRRSLNLCSIAILFLLWLPAGAGAWQVVSFEQIPPGAVALTAGFDRLWCAYRAEGDSVLRLFDPDSGGVVGEYRPPQAACRGIAYRDSAVWFLGEGVIYRLDERGEVSGQFNAPYERMRGLEGVEEGFWTTAYLGGIPYLALFSPEGDELARFRCNVGEPGDIAGDGSYLWITDPVEGLIHQVDPRQQRTVNIYPTPAAGPTGITIYNDLIYLIDEGAGEEGDILYRINPEAAPEPRLLPASRYHDFGITIINFPAAWSLAIYNVGSLDLQLFSIGLALGNAGFRLGDMPEQPVIAPGQYIVAQLSFSPIRYGPHSDTLLLASNDPVEPLVRVILDGTGLIPFARLGVWPETVDFGEVRADPWRDGSRREQLHLFNEGANDMRVDSLLHRVVEIFHIEPVELPWLLSGADTLTLNIWFTPHQGIHYIDTLLVITRGGADIATNVYLIGHGSDSVYAAGTVLWQHRLEAGGSGWGAVARHDDITGDGIDEVVTVAPAGTVTCLNGFGSGDVDCVWRQEFPLERSKPEGILPRGCLEVDRELNGDGIGDVVFGSGGADRALYGLDGGSGELLWRWDSGNLGIEGRIVRVLVPQDVGGDGCFDPLVLLSDSGAGASRLVRIDGASGRRLWLRSLPGNRLLESIADLDGNGLFELVTADAEGMLYVLSGGDGGAMQRLDLTRYGGISFLKAVPDLNRDGVDDILVSPSEGGVMGYSVSQGLGLWYIDFDLEGSGAQYGSLTDLACDGGTVAIATERRWAALVDATREGEIIWIRRLDEVPVALAFQPDLDGDGMPELTVGFESGLVECRSGFSGGCLWSFRGDELGVGMVSRIESFEDVDLGGTADVLVHSADGVVRCVSSFGDLAVPGPVAGAVPGAFALGLYPNPFNGGTTLLFSLDWPAKALLSIWDCRGRLVELQDLGVRPAGRNCIALNRFGEGRLAAGVYLVRLDAASRSRVCRAVLLR